MNDAPNLIGLVGDGTGRWALWNREDDRGRDAVQYLRADLHAARIEALEAQVAAARELVALLEGEQARADSLARQVDVADGALRLIESISVHSGGEIHGVTADHWQQGLEFAQRVASDAIAARATLTGEKP